MSLGALIIALFGVPFCAPMFWCTDIGTEFALIFLKEFLSTFGRQNATYCPPTSFVVSWLFFARANCLFRRRIFGPFLV